MFCRIKDGHVYVPPALCPPRVGRRNMPRGSPLFRDSAIQPRRAAGGPVSIRAPHTSFSINARKLLGSRRTALRSAMKSAHALEPPTTTTPSA